MPHSGAIEYLTVRIGQYVIVPANSGKQVEPSLVQVVDRAKERKTALYDLVGVHRWVHAANRKRLPVSHRSDGTVTQEFLDWRKVMIRLLIEQHYGQASVIHEMRKQV